MQCPDIGKVIWSSAKACPRSPPWWSYVLSYLMLVGLPEGNHKADAVAEALAAAVAHLPEHLARSLTWDQGHEMAEHAKFTNEARDRRLPLRSQVTLAARLQREHQRTPAPIPAPATRPQDVDPSRPRRHRARLPTGLDKPSASRHHPKH